MKIQKGYILRQVMDYYVIIDIDSSHYTADEIMSVNETGAFLWKLLENEIQKEDLLQCLMKEYDIDAETAGKDIDVFLDELRAKELIVE